MLPTSDDRHLLDACFLGPYGENDALLEKIVVEFLRDHVYWRRNFHPEDPPAISTRAAQHPDYQAFEARLRRELHQLSAALKRSVPFHSPRYLGHMVSDLLLPGLAAQMLTLPYNPNNVSEDAAPVTVDGGAGRPAAGPHARLPARSGATRLRLRSPDLWRHRCQLPGAATGTGAEGIPGGPAGRRRARAGIAGRRLDCLQPHADRWCRAAGRMADVADDAARNGAPGLARSGHGGADRTTRPGRLLCPAPGSASTQGAGTDHRALFVEQGRETAGLGPQSARVATAAWHAPGYRGAGSHPGAFPA